MPDTLEELRKAFNINKAFEQKGSKKETTSQLTSSHDLDRLVLEELIHNSLAGQNTKEYMPSLVFRIFDRYPASSLEEALFAMKSKSLVARLRVHVPRRRALPISTMSYSLSVAYERLFEMPLSPHLFPAAKSFLKMFREGSFLSSFILIFVIAVFPRIRAPFRLSCPSCGSPDTSLIVYGQAPDRRIKRRLLIVAGKISFRQIVLMKW